MLIFSEQEKQAFGLSEKMLIAYRQDDRDFLLHEDMLDAFKHLQADAAEAGFLLALASSHRGFERQLAIWNAKAAGKRILYDRNGKVLDYQSLGKQQLLESILCWSAVPGLSRHHWGSDIDVFDASAMQLADVRLIPGEVEGNGPCAAMHEWLTEKIENNHAHGFFRPYQNNACQVAEEKWHLSYQPVACRYQQYLNADKLCQLWRQHDMALIDVLEPVAQSIIRDYARLDFNRLPDWVGASSKQ